MNFAKYRGEQFAGESSACFLQESSFSLVWHEASRASFSTRPKWIRLCLRQWSHSRQGQQPSQNPHSVAAY